MPLFLRCFRVQRQSSDGRYSWVSFKNADYRLFKMYTDSVKDFKDRFYVLRPVSTSAANQVLRQVPVTNDQGHVVRDEWGNIVMKLSSVFPFRWWNDHFLKDAREYFYSDDDMDEQDLAAHVKLCRYVEKFSATYWVSRTGEPIVEEKGNGVYEDRAIEMKPLLACKSAAEARVLLGCMMFFRFFVYFY